MTKKLRDYLITTCGLKDDVKDGALELIYPRTIAAYEAGYEQAKKDLSCVQQRLNMLEDHNMTIDNVISCLEKHNEIHSHQEPRAYYITKALNIAIDFLKNHRWHYVQDELPETSSRYFVYTGGDPFILNFDTETGSFGYWVVLLGDDLGVQDEYFETVEDRGEDEVIAWQCLPDLPPKERI